jgi:hypothetical protein
MFQGEKNSDRLCDQRCQGEPKPADGLWNPGRIAMGFSEDNGSFEGAKELFSEFMGGGHLLTCALSNKRLDFFRKGVCDSLKHAGHGLLHPSVRIGKFQRKRAQQTSAAPELRRAIRDVIKKRNSPFDGISNRSMRTISQNLRAPLKRPIQHRNLVLPDSKK